MGTISIKTITFLAGVKTPILFLEAQNSLLQTLRKTTKKKEFFVVDLPDETESKKHKKRLWCWNHSHWIVSQ